MMFIFGLSLALFFTTTIFNSDFKETSKVQRISYKRVNLLLSLSLYTQLLNFYLDNIIPNNYASFPDILTQILSFSNELETAEDSFRKSCCDKSLFFILKIDVMLCCRR